MALSKYIFVQGTFVLFLLLLIGCASTSSTIRYDGKKKDKLDESISVVRYDNNSVTEIDTSISLQDEDIPEYQDPSDLPEDESEIDLTALMKSFENKTAGSEVELLAASKRDLMLMEIIKYMNTPYKFGGNSLNGIDCSAFTQNVYRDSWLLDINRSARQQYLQGIPIEERSELKFGDLVFFNTRRRVKPGHVGIYIGDNLFVHASSTSGVKVSSLDHPYYDKRYMGARRIDDEALVQ